MTKYLALFWLLLAPQISWGKPLPAFVDSGEIGQAILIHRLGSCYGITPAHVIADSFYATLVGGLPAAPQGEADLLMTFGYDLALLRVSGGVEEKCKATFHKAANIDSLFRLSNTGYLQTVNSDGSIARQQVNIVSTGMLHVQIAPVAGGEALMKGMSGSLLEIEEQPAGLLLSVDPENGHGKVLRYDRVTETIAPFFGDGRTATPALPAQTTKSSASGQNYSISSWSSPPINAESRALNLLDEDTVSSWYSRARDFPIDIEIRLSDAKAKVISRLDLLSEGVTPDARLVRDFEVMVSTRAKGGWISVANGTLFPKESLKSLKFAPVRGKRLLFRVYSNWGDPDAVGLSEIRIQ